MSHFVNTHSFYMILRIIILFISHARILLQPHSSHDNWDKKIKLWNQMTNRSRSVAGIIVFVHCSLMTGRFNPNNAIISIPIKPSNAFVSMNPPCELNENMKWWRLELIGLFNFQTDKPLKIRNYLKLTNIYVYMFTYIYHDNVIKWNHFRVTGPLCCHRWIHRTKASEAFEVFFDLRLNKRLNKQSWGWWFETQSRPLWPHCNVYFKVIK